MPVAKDGRQAARNDPAGGALAGQLARDPEALELPVRPVSVRSLRVAVAEKREILPGGWREAGTGALSNCTIRFAWPNPLVHPCPSGTRLGRLRAAEKACCLVRVPEERRGTRTLSVPLFDSVA